MTAHAIPHAPARVEARATLRRHGRTFHFAGRLLGPVHGARAARLYAFCRHVDDLADTAKTREAGSAALAHAALAVRERRALGPETADFLDLMRETGMDARAPLALIEGVTSDLDAVRVSDEAELIDYAYSVAGVVGLMMCDVLDVGDPAAAPFAIDLGMAMQLTNIARDVGADAALGRRYLPGAWVGEAEPEAIADPGPALQGALQTATRQLISLAERYYESGEQGLGFLPAHARPAILTAARVYRAIGARIAANGWRSWDRRAVVSGPEKLARAASALAAATTTTRARAEAARHDAALHAAITRRFGAHAP